jgi:hypothetical protein
MKTSDNMSTENFETRDVKWTPDGKGVVLVDTRPDKAVFCCAFEVEDDM